MLNIYIIRELQIKTMMYHYKPIWMAKILLRVHICRRLTRQSPPNPPIPHPLWLLVPNQKCHQEDNQLLDLVIKYNEMLTQAEKKKTRIDFSLKVF